MKDYYANDTGYIDGDDLNIILSLEDIKKVAKVVQFGPIITRNIELVEKQMLTNNCCVYWLGLATVEKNPFNIACIRNLDRSLFENKLDFKVRVFISHNLDPILDPKYYKESIITDEMCKYVSEEYKDKDVIGSFTTAPMEDEDFLFLIHNNIMSEASLIASRINSLYHSHGQDMFDTDTWLNKKDKRKIVLNIDKNLLKQLNDDEEDTAELD